MELPGYFQKSLVSRSFGRPLSLLSLGLFLDHDDVRVGVVCIGLWSCFVPFPLLRRGGRGGKSGSESETGIGEEVVPPTPAEVEDSWNGGGEEN